jgi:dTDP-4-amino-4,6-dideoxygalactose transaminase
MPIPFLDLKRQYAEIEAEIADAAMRVFSSGVYILGPAVERFEKEWANFCGVAGAAAVASGTDALTLALIASGAVRKHLGDEIITSPLTSPYTALSIVNAGGIPIFADIDPDTYTLNPEKIEEAITPRTRAIIPVHLYGHVAEMKAISEIAARRDLFVVEDAAHAHGARLVEEDVGTSKALTATFSFYPTKNLGGYGDGGAVISNDESLIDRIKILRQGGHAPALSDVTQGRNSRLDEFQAAVLSVKLKRLEKWNQRRQRLAKVYTEGLRQSPQIVVPSVDVAKSHTHHLYVIQHPERDLLHQYLAARGIETMIHYPALLHQQPLFRQATQSSLPVAEHVVKNILSLPLYPQLEEREVEAVIEAVLSYKNQW